MSISRPVIAFALLSQCSEVLKTDLLGGIALLVKPLIRDLAGQRFNAEILSERISSTYGLAISAQALTDFLPRFVRAGIVATRQISNFVNEVIFADVREAQPLQEENSEGDFQSVIDKFLDFCKPNLSTYKLTISKEQLISGLLDRLATFDFRAIDHKSDRTEEDSSTSNLDSKLDVLVAGFINEIHEGELPTFELLIKVAEGALGAELVFDLRAPKTTIDLSKVSVVLDTPILLSLLDLSDEQHHQYAEELVKQIKHSHAKPAAYKHSIEEAESILYAIKDSVYSYGQAYGPTADRLSQPNYLLYFETMMGKIESRLTDRGVRIIAPTPRSEYRFLRKELEEQLTDSLYYDTFMSESDRRRRQRDAQSVAETIRLRGLTHVSAERIADCKCVFVTPNFTLQQQARAFLVTNEIINANDLSPVITDRYFAGLSWLMFGGSSESSLTTAKLLTNCATALRAKPDIIEKTKRILALVDPQQAEHFEILMTKERAARYLTQITLGDSQLLTSENTSEIYEKLEATIAEKTAQQKDEYYGEQLADKQKTLDAVKHDLADAKKAIETLRIESVKKDADLESQQKGVTLLSGKVHEDEHRRKQAETKIRELESQVKMLADAAKKAEEEALRAKSIAIKYALKKAKKVLNVVERIGGALLILATVMITYYDKFIIPYVPEINQKSTNIVLFIFYTLLALLSYSTIIRTLAWKLSKKKYENELSDSGYESSEPEFELNFEKFDIKAKSNSNASDNIKSN